MMLSIMCVMHEYLLKLHVVGLTYLGSTGSMVGGWPSESMQLHSSAYVFAWELRAQSVLGHGRSIVFASIKILCSFLQPLRQFD